MITDYASLVNFISRSSRPSKKRFMIDLTGAREAYDNQEIYYIGRIPTADNLADVFTKIGTNRGLEKFLNSDVLE